jgi:peptidoglycan/LPS O-acetylase OafA/YrhL
MPTPTGPAHESRIDAIDGLRALAILYVLMNHVNMRLLLAHNPYYKGLPLQLVWSLVWEGQQGVQIFFALSGFLITSTSIRRWGALPALNISDFYRIRFARIAPLLAALVAVLSGLHLLRVHNYVVSAKDGGLPNAILAVLTLRVGLLEATRGYLPANWDILWSLSVEELFYLVFPLACLALTRVRRLRLLPLIALLLSFVVLGPFARTVFTRGNEVWQEYSYLGGMDAIAMGALAAIAVTNRRLPRGLVNGLLGLGGVILTILLTCEIQMQRMGIEKLGLGMSLIGLATVMVCAAAAQSDWRFRRWMQPLLSYGRHSYEIYLTHMFVVFALFDWFVRAGKPMAWVAPLFVATIILAGLLGALVARYLSEPANRALRGRFRTSTTVVSG